MQKIVIIGGGSGSYNLLRGLKRYTQDLTAIVTMFDSGGSAGICRDEFGVLPPGDVRRCLLALSEESKHNLLLRQLFSYRFDKGTGLSGHSFGNLFLTVLKEITGSDIEAIEAAAQILKIKGRVLPVTLDRAHLCAELEDGTIIQRETNIDIPKHDPNLRIKRVFLDSPASAYCEVIDAIRAADKIIIGPGDLYTSIIPNLLVEGVPEAIKDSKAKKIFVCNVMTKFGETNDFKASDFLGEIHKYLGSSCVDVMICNDKQVSAEAERRYAEEHQFQVEIDKDAIAKTGVQLVCKDMIFEPDVIRHNPIKLADAIMKI
ncbi:YvcK family protein [Candidatus Woesearchaeota archaeon]|nr:YvcK family protein [Candidatus Woesearchaeota archaeon]